MYGRLHTMQQHKASIVLAKTLANPTRLAILELLFEKRAHLCVNEIAEHVGISQSLASHQLAYLEARGVVDGHRVGKTMCYVLQKNATVTKLGRIITILS